MGGPSRRGRATRLSGATRRDWQISDAMGSNRRWGNCDAVRQLRDFCLSFCHDSRRYGPAGGPRPCWSRERADASSPRHGRVALGAESEARPAASHGRGVAGASRVLLSALEHGLRESGRGICFSGYAFLGVPRTPSGAGKSGLHRAPRVSVGPHPSGRAEGTRDRAKCRKQSESHAEPLERTERKRAARRRLKRIGRRVRRLVRRQQSRRIKSRQALGA